MVNPTVVHGDKEPNAKDREAMAAIVKATVELMGDETMSVELPNGKGPGKWQRIIIDEFGDHPRWSAIIRCPECKVFLPIPNHTISADGQVTPSVGHDPKWPACSWHPTPKLIGWAPCPPDPEPRPTFDCGRCGSKGRQLSGWGIAGGFPLVCPECMKRLLSESR